jgi:hypothetical protein
VLEGRGLDRPDANTVTDDQRTQRPVYQRSASPSSAGKRARVTRDDALGLLDGQIARLSLRLRRSRRQLTSLRVPNEVLDALRLNAAVLKPRGEILATGGEDGQELLGDLGTKKAGCYHPPSPAWPPVRTGPPSRPRAWTAPSGSGTCGPAQPLGVLGREPQGVTGSPSARMDAG